MSFSNKWHCRVWTEHIQTCVCMCLCYYETGTTFEIRIKVAVSHIHILPTYIILANNQRIVDRIDHCCTHHLKEACVCVSLCIWDTTHDWIKDHEIEKTYRHALKDTLGQSTSRVCFSLWIRMICIYFHFALLRMELFLIGNVFLCACFSFFTSSSMWMLNRNVYEIMYICYLMELSALLLLSSIHSHLVCAIARTAYVYNEMSFIYLSTWH